LRRNESRETSRVATETSRDGGDIRDIRLPVTSPRWSCSSVSPQAAASPPSVPRLDEKVDDLKAKLDEVLELLSP
jgi:hypothetical protein